MTAVIMSLVYATGDMRKYFNPDLILLYRTNVSELFSEDTHLKF